MFKSTKVILIVISVVVVIIIGTTYFLRQETKEVPNNNIQNTVETKSEAVADDAELSLAFFNSDFNCLTGSDFEKIKQNYLKNKNKKNTYLLADFLENKEISDILANSEYFEICSDYNILAFVSYGQYDKEEGNKFANNNLIGTFSQYGELKTIQTYCPPFGDIGFVHINGFIEANLVYSCGGGDGGSVFNRVYILDKVTGKSKNIKDCSCCYESKIEKYECKCPVNILNLQEIPF